MAFPEKTADLFAENFLVDQVTPEVELPEPRYDAARSLNLAPDGSAYVDLLGATQTGTLTEVRGEHQDRDDCARASDLDTVTKVRGERSDIEAGDAHVPVPPSSAGMLITKTEAGPEGPDHVMASLIGTQTRFGAEDPDRAFEGPLDERSDRTPSALVKLAQASLDA